MKKIALVVSSCLITSVFAATLLSPNQNNKSGHIPSGYTDLEFKLSNANWVKNLYLPVSANDKDKITLSSNAQSNAYLDTSNTNFPKESLTINQKDKFTFIFNAQKQQWILQTEKTYSPPNNIQNFQVPLETKHFFKVELKDNKWSHAVSLPNDIANGTFVEVSSSATWNSKIDTANLLFPSTYVLKKGDILWFEYYTKLGKWVPIYVKPSTITLGASVVTIAKPNAPVTQVNIPQNSTAKSLSLPTDANDRDRLIFQSAANKQITLNNEGTNTQSTLILQENDRYEFMYVADLSKWVLMSAPELVLADEELNSSQLPNMVNPTLRVKVNNQNLKSKFNLPLKAQLGDKVIFTSKADNVIEISAANKLNSTLTKDETQRYVYGNDGWVLDTSTIDILMVTSTEVSNKLGANAAKLRMINSTDLTNKAAENSKAKLYIRPAGYLTYTIPSSKFTLSQVLDSGRTDKNIQAERKRLSADGVYYEGAETGCGLAHVNYSPNAYNMIGTGSTSCGTTVMRHELGHNFGLNHHDKKNITGKGFNHALGSTVMGGNNLPYYSSPDLYSSKYGIRLGEAAKIDSVSIINKNAVGMSNLSNNNK